MGRTKNTKAPSTATTIASGKKASKVKNVKDDIPIQVRPAVETLPDDNDKVNKSADARRASAALNGETSPTKIVAWLKGQGVAWAQRDDTTKKHSGLITSALNAGKAKKSHAADMDLDTILVRLEQVKVFAKQHGGKEKLVAMIANAAEVEKMAVAVGGLDNLSKFAAKV